MNSFDYSAPATEEQALSDVDSRADSAFVAGGTNLLDLYKYNLTNPRLLVGLGGLVNLKSISTAPSGKLRLGALATNAETAYHPLIEERYPLLSRAILAGASAQIRNMATNGGNLMQRTRCCYFYDPDAPCNKRKPGSGCPAVNGLNRMHAILGGSEHCIAVFPSDMCVALAALDAVVEVIGLDGTRRIPLSDFHRLPGDHPERDNTLQPGELITAIELPSKGFSKNYSYLKLRDRHSYAFALVSVATGLELDRDGHISEVRIALGGVAAKPWRLREAEEFLLGKSPDSAAFSEAADILLAGAKGFGQNNFKIGLAKRAIVRNGMMALDPSTQQPGAKPSL